MSVVPDPLNRKGGKSADGQIEVGVGIMKAPREIPPLLPRNLFREHLDTGASIFKHAHSSRSSYSARLRVSAHVYHVVPLLRDQGAGVGTAAKPAEASRPQDVQDGAVALLSARRLREGHPRQGPVYMIVAPICLAAWMCR